MIKYLSYGPEVKVIQELNDGRVLVEPLFEDQEFGDTYEGRPFIVAANQLFDKPPVQKRHEEVVRLNEEISELTKKKNDLRQEIKDIEALHAERLALIQQHKELELLEEFLKGNITHYVEIHSYGTPDIIPFEESVSEFADKDGEKGLRRLRLLGLFGKATGDLGWGLNKYRDGSGIFSTVIPCTSSEEAIKVVRNWIENEISDAKEGKNRKKPSRKIWDFGLEFGYPVPNWYCKAVVETEEKNRREKIDKLEKELADLKAGKDKKKKKTEEFEL